LPSASKILLNRWLWEIARSPCAITTKLSSALSRLRGNVHGSIASALTGFTFGTPTAILGLTLNPGDTFTITGENQFAGSISIYHEQAQKNGYHWSNVGPLETTAPCR